MSDRQNNAKVVRFFLKKVCLGPDVQEIDSRRGAKFHSVTQGDFDDVVGGKEDG